MCDQRLVRPAKNHKTWKIRSVSYWVSQSMTAPTNKTIGRNLAGDRALAFGLYPID